MGELGKTLQRWSLVGAGLATGIFSTLTVESYSKGQATSADIAYAEELIHTQLTEAGANDGFTVMQPRSIYEHNSTYEKQGLSPREASQATVTLSLGSCSLRGVKVTYVRGNDHDALVSDITSYSVRGVTPTGDQGYFEISDAADLKHLVNPNHQTSVADTLDEVCPFVHPNNIDIDASKSTAGTDIIDLRGNSR